MVCIHHTVSAYLTSHCGTSILVKNRVDVQYRAGEVNAHCVLMAVLPEVIRLGIQQDDLVRINESGELAFVEHVGGQTSEEDEEDDDDDDDDSTESQASYERHPLFGGDLFEGASLLNSINVGRSHSHETQESENSVGLIDTYDDGDDDGSDDDNGDDEDDDDDDDDNESNESGRNEVSQTHAPHRFRSSIASSNVRSASEMGHAQNLSSSRNSDLDSSDSQQRVPVGFARVMLVDAYVEKVLPVDNLTVEDRAFIPGDVVYKVLRRGGTANASEMGTAMSRDHASDANAVSAQVVAVSDRNVMNMEQSAIVMEVSKSLLVRPLVACQRTPRGRSPRSAADDRAWTVKISSRELEFFSGFRDGCFVVADDWVGRVTFLSELVSVRFSNGSVCQLPGNPDALVPSDTHDGVPLDEVEGVYYPGQCVKAEPSVWRSARWLSGSYSRQRKGYVTRVEVTQLGVDWIARKCTDDVAPEEASFPPEIISPDKVSPLTAFRHLWWRVGDRGHMPWVRFQQMCTRNDGGRVGADENLQSTEDSRSRALDDDHGDVDDDNDDDSDDEWEEVPATSEPSRTPQNTRDLSNAEPAARSSSAITRRKRYSHEGRLLAAQRRVMRAPPDVQNLRSRIGGDQVVLEVIGTNTFLDLLWQDGSLTRNVPAVSVLSNRHVGAYEFFPGMFVAEAKDELDDYGESSLDAARTRTGVVVSVNPKDRIAHVRWQAADACQYTEKEEVSVYELSEQSVYDMQLGDTVLRLPRSACNTDASRPELNEWVGEIVGCGIGHFVVQWHHGRREEVPPDCLLVVGSADDDEDFDGLGEEESDSAEEPHSGDDEDSPRNDILTLEENWAPEAECSTATERMEHVSHEQADRITSLADEIEKAISKHCARYLHYNPSNRERFEQIGIDAADKVLANMTAEDKAEPRLDDICKAAVDQANEIVRDTATGGQGSAISRLRTDEVAEFWNNLTRAICRRLTDCLEEFATTHASEFNPRAIQGASPSAENSSDTKQCGGDGEKSFPAREAVPDPVLRAEDRFSVIDSFTNHQYASAESSVRAQIPGFHVIIQKEWSRLSRHLPSGIFVRASEDRLDLLRCAIVGPKDTPYENGLFFFDVLLPPEYPSTPPKVHFMSHGRRLNPNLYEDGKVCLSILGTWDGEGVEKWDPRHSNVLRVLLSLQAMVFVEEPYFNEAGYEKQCGTEEGIVNSRLYNESAFLLSLKHIVSSLREGGAPPEFTDLVRHHYVAVRFPILERCRRLLHYGAWSESSTVRAEADPSSTLTSPPNGVFDSVSVGFKCSLSSLFPKLETALNAI